MKTSWLESVAREELFGTELDTHKKARSRACIPLKARMEDIIKRFVKKTQRNICNLISVSVNIFATAKRLGMLELPSVQDALAVCFGEPFLYIQLNELVEIITDKFFGKRVSAN